MNKVERLRQIAANNREPITGYGMAGCAQVFASFGSPAMRKRLAAGSLLNLILGQQYVKPELRSRVAAHHLNRVRELLHG